MVSMKKIYLIIFLFVIIGACKSAQDNLQVGEFTRIYDASVGETEQWYINDHCFIRDANGIWHLFGITHQEPMNPIGEDNFAHAVSTNLTSGWEKRHFALTVDEKAGESHLWAPYVISHDGLYYMYYCGGSNEGNDKYKINLATSKNLNDWERHPANPMVVDGYDARDPFILKLKDEWIMYYTATSKPQGGNYTVNAVVSKDLIHWSDRRIVFTDPSIGKWGGPTESPTIIQRGGYYYLFIGPRDDYRGTCVYKSKDPFDFKIENFVRRINSHAAEVIKDVNGDWYVSHCGWGQDGVYLASLEWNDGIDNKPNMQETYKNPVIDEILADPDVLKYKDNYYLYPTGNGKGYQVFASDDLVHWVKKQMCYTDPRGGLWAPDLFYNEKGDGKIYLYYTANNPKGGKLIGVAVSDDPLGPFVDKGNIREDNIIDAHLFSDDDSKLYLYYVKTGDPFVIFVQQMSDPLTKKGEPKEVLRPTVEWEQRRGRVTEGPFVLKHKNIYYLMYSGSGADGPEYAIGYATSKSPLGPFVKYENNPIAKQGNGVYGPGHHCVIDGQNGKLWMIYHQQNSEKVGWDRFLAMDPVWFDEEELLHAKTTRGTDEKMQWNAK